jgi:hypothetical protein
MDPTAAPTTATSSTGNLDAISTALSSTQGMMADAVAQQEQMNAMKTQFDGQMAQLALQSSIEEKLSTTLERMAQSIAQ